MAVFGGLSYQLTLVLRHSDLLEACWKAKLCYELSESRGNIHRPELTDLAVELAAKSAGFCRSLPDRLTSSLADLVRAMNCY